MPPANPWLSRYAKLVVAAAFFLIFVGGHTTTSSAGMAFPDWPLSHGSVNPAGWWTNFMERLEHGHRLTAETVGLLVGILCAWIWRSKLAVPGAIVISLVLATTAKFLGASPTVVMHIGLWSSALVFTNLLFIRRDAHPLPAAARWLAFAAYIGVLAQAVLGGLRVTIEAAGAVPAATVFRVIHGCFAQIELCLLVALAAMLSPVFEKIKPREGVRPPSRFAWITAGVVFFQLIVGATMRHLGAGLVIPTFPRLPDGGWLLLTNNMFMNLNFTHTRLGALAVTVCVIALALRTLASADGERLLVNPAIQLLMLLAAQITLGISVIWNLGQHPLLTTFHVVNGAAVLAITVVLALRASRFETPREINTASAREPALQRAAA